MSIELTSQNIWAWVLFYSLLVIALWTFLFLLESFFMLVFLEICLSYSLYNLLLYSLLTVWTVYCVSCKLFDFCKIGRITSILLFLCCAGIQPRAFCMLTKRSTTELYFPPFGRLQGLPKLPQPSSSWDCNHVSLCWVTLVSFLI